MKRKINALFFCVFLFSGCVSINECGVSTKYYNDCVEGYDAQGVYFKKCPPNNIYDSCKKEEEEFPSLEDCLNCN
ncbi:MAG: hypothetical protein LBP89_04530 [Helicobacteraceae bacterium]|nr:hypothetical protein [Helicobacteraceae bacterium]